MKWSISRVFITVLIAAVCAACSNIYDSDGASVDAIYDDGVLSVGMEGDDTRTYIGDDRHIYWNADDLPAHLPDNRQLSRATRARSSA